jgi:2-iminobutanoate/2-iminopropanoate deaminase
MTRIAVHPEGAAPPAAPLSPGVRIGNLLQVSGQIPVDAEGEPVGETVGEQTAQAMRNVLAVLAAGGASETDVLMFRIYLTDVAHFAEMNEVYAEFLSEPKPARTTVYVGLPPGKLVEIDALAVLPSS